jgi:hypothetical protein
MGNEEKRSKNLSRWQVAGAAIFLLSWVSLFAGGITIDTTQFRCAISPAGAQVLANEARPSDAPPKDVCKPYESVERTWMTQAVAWVGILLFFLPLNLAMVSAVAGALGAFGNEVNLEYDQMEPAPDAAEASPYSTDNSSPILSGLLRGLFIYLFFISGLLLFDDKPFSSPGPGQYIRLAGFISLFSFLVNYRPHLFKLISDWALTRIGRDKATSQPARGKEVTYEHTRDTRDKVTVTRPAESVTVNGDGEVKATAPIEVHGSSD